jgi:hypothetical protein
MKHGQYVDDHMSLDIRLGPVNLDRERKDGGIGHGRPFEKTSRHMHTDMQKYIF